MRRKYQTLDEYLDDLDKIKEQIAEETKGMSAAQIEAYFARNRKDFERHAGKKSGTPKRRRPVVSRKS